MGTEHLVGGGDFLSFAMQSLGWSLYSFCRATVLPIARLRLGGGPCAGFFCLPCALSSCCLLAQADWGVGAFKLALWMVQFANPSVQRSNSEHQVVQSCLERERFERAFKGVKSFSGALSSWMFMGQGLGRGDPSSRMGGGGQSEPQYPRD